MKKSIEQINQEWHSEFIETFNENKAAIVLSVAIDEKRRPVICVTTDISPAQVIEILLQILSKLKV